jgi:hypothetical protein
VDIGGCVPTDIDGCVPTDIGGCVPTDIDGCSVLPPILVDIGGCVPTDIDGCVPTDIDGCVPTDIDGCGVVLISPHTNLKQQPSIDITLSTISSTFTGNLEKLVPSGNRSIVKFGSILSISTELLICES